MNIEKYAYQEFNAKVKELQEEDLRLQIGLFKMTVNQLIDNIRNAQNIKSAECAYNEFSQYVSERTVIINKLAKEMNMCDSAMYVEFCQFCDKYSE